MIGEDWGTNEELAAKIAELTARRAALDAERGSNTCGEWERWVEYHEVGDECAALRGCEGARYQAGEWDLDFPEPVESCGRRLDVCEMCSIPVGEEYLNERSVGLGYSNPYPETVRMCVACERQQDADDHDEREA